MTTEVAMIHPEEKMIDPARMVLPTGAIHLEADHVPMIATVQAAPIGINWIATIQPNMTGMVPAVIAPIREIFSPQINRSDPTSDIPHATVLTSYGITSKTSRIYPTSAITVVTMHEPSCRMRSTYPIESAIMGDTMIGHLTASGPILHASQETMVTALYQSSPESPVSLLPFES